MSKGWLLMKPLQGGATPSLPPTSYCHCPSYHKGRPAPRWCTVHTSYNEHKHHSAKCKVLKYSSAAFQAALLSCHLTLHQGSSLVGLSPIEHLVSLLLCSYNSLLCSHHSLLLSTTALAILCSVFTNLLRSSAIQQLCTLHSPWRLEQGHCECNPFATGNFYLNLQ